MERDRPQRISDLYHRALERSLKDRGAFLREACGGDEALRGEIEALLQYEAAATFFLETPAVGPAAKTRPPAFRC